MSKKYLVNYCLDKESDFEDFHDLYNDEKKELLLSIKDVELLLDRCVSDSDNVDISYGGELKGKWNVLEVHGIDGYFYNLQYLLSGSLYVLNNVPKDYVIKHLDKIDRSFDDLKLLGFKGKSM